MNTPARARGRGGRGGHEPRLRIQAREIRAYDLSIAGKSQTEIAAALGISQPAVSKLLRRVEDRHAAEMAGDARRLKVRCIAQYRHLYNKAMQAFDRSTGPINQRRQRKIVGIGQGESTVAELMTEEGAGDPRYLEVARRAVGDLCKLAGLDTAPMTELTNANDLSQVGTQELEFRLQRAAAALTSGSPPQCQKVPEPPPVAEPHEPTLTPEQAYAEVLERRRRASGAGSG